MQQTQGDSEKKQQQRFKHSLRQVNIAIITRVIQLPVTNFYFCT